MNCGICGGIMVLIRGMYPKQDKREVCPTCLAEKLDQIRILVDKNYGVASTEIPDKLKKII